MKITSEKLKDILSEHKLWVEGKGGVRANLRGANLRGANLWGANLRGANLWGANLRDANLRDANLWGANLWGANLRGANLEGANLWGANLQYAKLQYANLEGADLQYAKLQYANLEGANLLCFSNMREIRTMQIDTWVVGYTADTLQIGCQRHSIEKWRKWDTPAGRKWIDNMDQNALKWSGKNLA